MTKESLSRDVIVEAAIELLDLAGEPGLTFRALAARLATGSGAIYWHVASKHDLLTAAGDAVVARALARARTSPTPHEAIRRIATGVFDAVDAHAWLGAQLSITPWPTATLSIFERIGRHVRALPGSVGPHAHFTSASTLVSYIIGVSVQNATQGRRGAATVDRADFLAAEAARWRALDADEYEFTRTVAGPLRRHDDRAEFQAGLDLILTGIAQGRTRS